MKLALVGYGRMGKEVERIALQRGHQITVVFDVDRPFDASADLKGAELLIDFSSASAVPSTLRLAAERQLPVVEGTTGWSDEFPAVERIPSLTLLWSPNFSIGVFLFSRIVEAAADLISEREEFDCYVHEWHHSEKQDSPSGTALRLSELLVSRLKGKNRPQYECCHRQIEKKELHVTSTRVGHIPGIHEVGFDAPLDRIVLRHEARGREAFAHGAVLGAEWLLGRRGVFTMEDFITGRAD